MANLHDICVALQNYYPLNITKMHTMGLSFGHLG